MRSRALNLVRPGYRQFATVNGALEFLKKSLMRTSHLWPTGMIKLKEGSSSGSNSFLSSLKARLGQDFLLSESAPKSAHYGMKVLEIGKLSAAELDARSDAIEARLKAYAGSVKPLELVSNEMKTVSFDILEVSKSLYPEATEVSKYLLEKPSKRFRPVFSLMMNGALRASYPSVTAGQEAEVQVLQHKVCELSEMIHTASQMHDDVIDDSDERRGQPAAHIALKSNKLAILGGDFLLARACRMSANVGSMEVTQRMSYCVESLARGELLQMQGVRAKAGFTASDSELLRQLFEVYLTKTYFKTASLIAETVCSGAIVGGYAPEVTELAHDIGSLTGMAFQLHDDYLDLVATNEALGKPAGQDMEIGVATAPLILTGFEDTQTVLGLCERKMKGPGDLEVAMKRVTDGPLALSRTRYAVMLYAEEALRLIETLPGEPSDYHKGLASLIVKTITRRSA